MNKLLLKNYDPASIDMSKMDRDTFLENLLFLIPKTKHYCKPIDKQLTQMCTMPHTNNITSLEQYNTIVELIIIKNRLVVMRNLFVDFYEHLNDTQKKLYAAYFIKKDLKLCYKIRKHYKPAVTSMARGFMTYMKLKANIDEKELIINPIIHDSYVIALANKTMDKKGNKAIITDKKGNKMTIRQMKDAIAKVYDTATWKKKVKNMRDDQVVAVYYNFRNRGMLGKTWNRERQILIRNEKSKDDNWQQLTFL